MILIFEYQDYRKYINDLLNHVFRKEIGKKTILSKAIGIHSSLLTKILKGENNFTLDQAWKCAKFFKLSALERDYLLTLIDMEKVVDTSLKEHFLEKLKNMKSLYDSPRENTQFKSDKEKDIEKSTFYSYWFYSAVRLLTSIPEFQTAEKISVYLGIQKELVEQVLVFLVDTGLCKKNGESFILEKEQTWLAPESPHLFRHFINWRMKAIQDLHLKTKYSARGTLVMALSEDALIEIQRKTRDLIEEVRQKAVHSTSERLAYLNIDLFDF